MIDTQLSGGIDGLVDPLSGETEENTDLVEPLAVEESTTTSESGITRTTTTTETETVVDDTSTLEESREGGAEATASDSSDLVFDSTTETSGSTSTSLTTSTSAASTSMSSMTMSTSMDGMDGMDGGHAGHAGHSMAVLALVADADATHVAVRSGSWFDPATWADGVIPGAGARVVISDGVSVLYDASSAAAIATIRVDGTLRFPSDVDTALSVDTIVVAAGGAFEMGSAAQPVTANAVITFVSVDAQADPSQSGLGLVGLDGAHIAIHGAEKTGRVVVDGDQLAGDSFLEIAGGVPADWAVGDVIVLAGTSYNAAGDNELNERFHDEVLEITSIGAGGVTFRNLDTGETTLRFDHKTIAGFDFDLHAINLSRSITFTSANGTDTAIAERGHIMVMDHDSVVANAAMIGLGRTDKSVVLDPLTTSFDINGTMTTIEGTGTNIPGRYPLHVHRAFDHGDDGGAVQFSGNAIWDAPGWGIVLHGSRGYIDANVVFDTVGAGIVTEDGDEVGYFTDNTVIKVASGTSGSDFPLQMVRLATAEGLPIDYGFHGNGFWFDTGYSVREATGNVAASTDHAGIFIYGHNDLEITRHVDPASAPAELHKYIQGGVIDPYRVPVGTVSGNEIYNAKHGMFLAGLTRDDNFNGGVIATALPLEHLDRSVISDTEIWGVHNSGIFIAYASNFEFRDLVIVGDPENPNDGYDVRGHDAGILLNKVAHNVVIDGVRIEGFHTGLDVGQGGGQGYHDVDPMDLFRISNVTLANNIQNFTPVAGRTGASPVLHPGFLDEPPFNPYAQLTGSFNVDASMSSYDPVAQVSVTRIDTNAFYLDASGSYDPDYRQDAQLTDREVIENSIAFYQWDFDGDGVADAFGRDVAVHFSGTASHEISLTLTDAQGAQTTTSFWVTPGAAAVSRQVLDDGGFDLPGTIYHQVNHVQNARIETGPDVHAWGASEAWGGVEGATWEQVDGHAQVSGPARPAQILDQLVADRAEHRGVELFGFDVKYHDQDGKADDLVVEIWGINGIPEIARYSDTAPTALYALEPFAANLLYSSGDLLQGADFNWQRIEAQVDFGSGYDYIYVRFVGDGIDASAGDIVAIDNVSLGGSQVDAVSPPTIISAALASVAENQTAAIDVDAVDDTDSEGAGLVYSLTGGTDQALFSIDAATGVVSFNAAPDFEAPGDADGDNVYDIQVTVTDGSGASVSQGIQIRVLDVAENQAPVITSAAGASVDENQTIAIDVDATDDSAGLVYSLTGGTDQALFSIDPSTGLVSFVAAPDFEAPGDADGDNVYDIQVTVTDASGASVSQSIQITVLDVDENQAPTIISADSAIVDENQTTAIDVDATDDSTGTVLARTSGLTEGTGLVYSLTGGADQALFSIDAATGLVSFLTSPDYENPGDADGDNIYDIQVTVTDSQGGTAVQDIQITVEDVLENQVPAIISAAIASVDENQTIAIDVDATDDSDSEGAGLVYSLTGGTDQTLFTIDPSTGLVSFVAAPDFEAPGDADGDNIYDIQVTVTDSKGASVSQNLQIRVLDVRENLAPVITSAAGASVIENQTAAIDVDAVDDTDSEGAGLVYSLTGGTDQALFSIDPSTGLVSFVAAPDFEAPGDADGDNVYDIQVTVTDASGASVSQDIQIAVLDVDENQAPTVTSAATAAVDENQTTAIDVEAVDDADSEGAGLSYSLTGGADKALFSIDAATGVVSFKAAPDYEAPGDAGGNNVYDIQVTVTDANGASSLQDIQITVRDVQDDTSSVTVHDNNGRNKLVGTSASEIFALRDDNKSDSLEGFEIGKDRLDVSAWGATSMDDLEIATLQHRNGDRWVQISDAEGYAELVVRFENGIPPDASQLTADSFLFAS